MRWPSATGVPLGWLPQPSPGAELRAGDPQRGEGLVLLDYGLIARWLQPWQGRPASTTERNVTSRIVEPVPHDVAIVACEPIASAESDANYPVQGRRQSERVSRVR